MVRTKADAGSSKVSVAKAPRKILGSSGGGGGAGSSNSPCRSAGSGSAKDRYSGGNTYNPQPTPNWQKGIGSFLKPGSEVKKNEEKIESPEKDEMDCSEAVCSKDSTADNEPIEKTHCIESPKSSKVDSSEISEEKSFNKNGVISDDDDDD